MKGITFKTILLGLVILLLVVSVGLIVFNTWKVSTLDTPGKNLWTERKWYFVAPTIMNVISVGVIAVLIIMGP